MIAQLVLAWSLNAAAPPEATADKSAAVRLTLRSQKSRHPGEHHRIAPHPQGHQEPS